LEHSPISPLRGRFSPTAWFTLQMVAGALVFVAAAWLFGGIAEDVVEGDSITLLDVRIAEWLHLHAFSPLTAFMLAVSHLNGIAGISVLAVLAGIYLLWAGERYWLLAFVLAVPGGILLNALLKLAFHRARPSFDDPLVTLTTFSFPSGHTLASTVFYTMLACYLLSRIATAGARIAIVATALLMIMLVALSRIYLGAHFLTDVLAAIALGVAWVSVCLMATATLQRRNAGRRKSTA